MCGGLTGRVAETDAIVAGGGPDHTTPGTHHIWCAAAWMGDFAGRGPKERPAAAEHQLCSLPTAATVDTLSSLVAGLDGPHRERVYLPVAVELMVFLFPQPHRNMSSRVRPQEDRVRRHRYHPADRSYGWKDRPTRDTQWRVNQRLRRKFAEEQQAGHRDAGGQRSPRRDAD